ncbi:MAG: hypothetical protein SPK85_04585 [Prevotella sp.]|nr:hypothetical protein [Prevotella sp.]
MTDIQTKTEFEMMLDDMVSILTLYCDTLNENYNKLRKESNLIDGDICYLFSIYEKRNDDRNNNIRLRIENKLKENSDFKIVSDITVTELFNKIWSKADVKNVDNTIYRMILYSRVRGLISESNLIELTEIKGNKFMPIDKEQIKVYITNKLYNQK